MQVPANTVKVRLGCDNCGHEDLYDLPIRRRILDYQPVDTDDAGSDPVLSAYQRPNGSDYHVLPCKYCALPCLKVLWWQDETVPMKQEQHHA